MVVFVYFSDSFYVRLTDLTLHCYVRSCQWGMKGGSWGCYDRRAAGSSFYLLSLGGERGKGSVRCEIGCVGSWLVQRRWKDGVAVLYGRGEFYVLWPFGKSLMTRRGGWREVAWRFLARLSWWGFCLPGVDPFILCSRHWGIWSMFGGCAWLLEWSMNILQEGSGWSDN